VKRDYEANTMSMHLGHDTAAVLEKACQTPTTSSIAQFIAVCSSQILVEMPYGSALFASQFRANKESFREADASLNRLISTIYKF
jgi:hypothetical protein